MTNDPYREARPSEGEGKTKTKVTFWAELWRPMATNSHGESLVSPIFGNQGDLTGWLRSRQRDYEQIQAFKRVSRSGHDFEDTLLWTDELVKPDPEAMHTLVEELKLKLLIPKPKR